MIVEVKRANGTGSRAYLRKDRRWVAKLTLGERDGRQWQRGYYGETAEEAERKRDEASRRLGLGLDVQDPTLRLADYLADWLRRLEVKGRSPKTTNRYRGIVEHQINPMLGAVPVSRLTTERVEGLLEELAATLAPRTVFHVRAVLRAGLRRAVRRGLLRANPAVDVEMPVGEPAAEQRSLDAAEAIALLGHLAGSRLEPIVTVAITTGLRQGEVLALRWDDVDLEARTLRVLGTKTKASVATTSLSETATRSLRAWRRRQASEQLLAGSEWRDRRGLVFTRPDGQPALARTVLGHLQTAAVDAGIGHLTFHQLRHTAGSLLQAEGVDIKTIQRVLRHATITTTADRYVHVVDETLRAAADRMDHALGKREAR